MVATEAGGTHPTGMLSFRMIGSRWADILFVLRTDIDTLKGEQ